jgi:hypothetical protein
VLVRLESDIVAKQEFGQFLFGYDVLLAEDHLFHPPSRLFRSLHFLLIKIIDREKERG